MIIIIIIVYDYDDDDGYKIMLIPLSFGHKKIFYLQLHFPFQTKRKQHTVLFTRKYCTTLQLHSNAL